MSFGPAIAATTQTALVRMGGAMRATGLGMISTTTTMTTPLRVGTG